MIRSELILEKDAVNKVVSIFKKRFPDKKPFVIEDTNTSVVVGSKIIEEFGNCDYHCFNSEEIYADDKHVEIIQNLLKKDPEYILIAVGSGTINDLCKRASYICQERPYICVATAPSVDGFTSNGAAITVNGLKTTLPCPAPVIVIADPSILSNAPIDMISAGYGDLAAKVPAGADWIIADILKIEKIDKYVWDMVQPALKENLSQPQKLFARDTQAAKMVFDGLIHTGFAMQEYFDSRPASGADHLMSHVWEMNDACTIEGKDVSHGFKVAIGTLTSTAMMEELLKLSKEDVSIALSSYQPESWQEREASIRRYVKNPSVQERQIEICKKKFLEGTSLKYRQDLILKHWTDIQNGIKNQIIPFDTLKTMLHTAGCPKEPEEIGLSIKNHQLGIRMAQMLRNRYTIVDLFYEIGLLDEVISKITDRKNKYFFSWKEN